MSLLYVTVPSYVRDINKDQQLAVRRLAPGRRANKVKGSKIDYLCNLSQGMSTVGKLWLVTYNVLVDHILVDLSF